MITGGGHESEMKRKQKGWTAEQTESTGQFTHDYKHKANNTLSLSVCQGFYLFCSAGIDEYAAA